MVLIFETGNSVYRATSTVLVATGGLVIVILGFIGAGVVISLHPYVKSYLVVVDVLIVATGLCFIIIMLWWHRANNDRALSESLYAGGSSAVRAAEL